MARQTLEKAREYARIRRELYPELLRQANRKSYLKHINKRRTQCREYYRLHRNDVLERTRRNNRMSLELRRAAESKRRARANASVSHYTTDDIRIMMVRQRGCCYWCKRKITKYYEVDHVWPLSKGGSNGIENIVLSCQSCNRHKNQRTPTDFAGLLL